VPGFAKTKQEKADTKLVRVRIRLVRESLTCLDGLGNGEVVVVGVLLPEFVLNSTPDGIAGLFGEVEEAAGLIGDGFQVADEGGAVGVVFEELLKTRIGTDVSVAIGEELRQVFFEVCRSHVVEIREVGVGHTATSFKPAG
jgi:hypothetical protein